LVDEHHKSVVQACGILGLSRTANYRPALASAEADAPVVAALTRIVAALGP